jgi:ABC-2 type transport system ATP-binding protein
MRRCAGVLIVVAALLAAVPAAQARDVTVTSFDGTPIAASLLPATGPAAGARAPTILMTHGWGGTRDRGDAAIPMGAFGASAGKALRDAGYNVLTWDSRGFGESGGTVTVDHKDFEGRDVQALLDWLATQPEAQLDGPGDPRAGMHGASYAGGIEFVAAAIDPRIDVIAPSIAWHSLLTALYREDLAKAGWGAVLTGAGLATATLLGVVAPGGIQTGTLDPHIMSAFLSGATTGSFSAEDKAWFGDRGPGQLVANIRIPTLLIQGTPDTLFTLSEAIRNHEVLARSGAPLKMMWFCGGHGVCLTGEGEAGKVDQAVIAWMDRYLKGDASVDTGPGFEWVADDAVWRSAARWPLPPGPPLVAEGNGTLVLNPADTASGTLITAGPALTTVVSARFVAPEARVDVVGEPAVTIAYSGTAVDPSTHVFAQIVDRRRNIVLGNQATPIPLTLDGRPHTVTRALEGVAASIGPGSDYSLQLTGGTLLYGPTRNAGTIDVANVRIELPTVRPGAVSGPGASGKPACRSDRRFRIRLSMRFKRAKVWVGGKRVKVTRRKGRLTAPVDLRGRRAGVVRVRVVGKTRGGKTRKRVHRYRVCPGGSARR